MVGGEKTSSSATCTAEQGGFQQRGLDSGLAKAAPQADGLTQKTYRSYCSLKAVRQTRFECGDRGGLPYTFFAANSAWDAAKQLNLEAVLITDPFLQLLDRLYQYDEDIELPSR